jgi:hypothetical protein
VNGPDALLRFSRYYGLNSRLLSSDDRYTIEGQAESLPPDRSRGHARKSYRPGSQDRGLRPPLDAPCSRKWAFLRFLVTHASGLPLLASPPPLGGRLIAASISVASTSVPLEPSIELSVRLPKQHPRKAELLNRLAKAPDRGVSIKY